MTIDAAGWFDWAVRDPGPDGRWAEFWNARTPMDAIYHHSLEGWFNPVASEGYNVMNDIGRFPTAWHWTVTRQSIYSPPGTVYQHYPVFARLQHANGGNIIGPGGESEGLFNMPLLPEQVAAWQRIHADMRAFTGKDYLRLPGNGQVGLCEHREAPGAQTACPSERYAPLWAVLEGDIEMTPAEKAAFEALVATVAGHEHRLLRIEVDEVSEAVPDAWLGPTLTELRERLAVVETLPGAPALATHSHDDIPEHRHEGGKVKR